MIEADLTNEEEVKRAFERGISAMGAIRVFLNLFFSMAMAPIISKSGKLHSTDIFCSLLSTNVTSKFLCCKYAANHMKDLATLEGTNERGVIVNLNSIVAADGPATTVSYAGTMACVSGMTVPLARDLGKYRIRVVTISGGGFKEFMEKSLTPEALKVMKG